MHNQKLEAHSLFNRISLNVNRMQIVSFIFLSQHFVRTMHFNSSIYFALYLQCTKTNHHIFILIYETVFGLHPHLFIPKPARLAQNSKYQESRFESRDHCIFVLSISSISKERQLIRRVVLKTRESFLLHSAANINAFSGGVWTLLIPKTCSNIPLLKWKQ